MKTKSIFFAGSFALSLATLVIVSALWMKRPRTAYIDLGKVYNDFALKKELEGKLKQVQLTRQTQLDSMRLDLNVLVKNIQAGDSVKTKPLQKEYVARRQQYALQNQAYSEENDRVTQAYDEQIWKQLNEYMKEYGKEHHYTYIFGAEGSGALMYADDSDNITEEMVAYVNERYKGKQGK